MLVYQRVSHLYFLRTFVSQPPFLSGLQGFCRSSSGADAPNSLISTVRRAVKRKDSMTSEVPGFRWGAETNPVWKSMKHQLKHQKKTMLDVVFNWENQFLWDCLGDFILGWDEGYIPVATQKCCRDPSKTGDLTQKWGFRDFSERFNYCQWGYLANRKSE